jgi:hypothetical protein
MVQKDRPGFMPRGNTLYVFSIDGQTIQASGDAFPSPVTTP